MAPVGITTTIHPVVGKVMPKYKNQREVVALEGPRFRIVGEPVFTREGGAVKVNVEVEEVQP